MRCASSSACMRPIRPTPITATRNGGDALSCATARAAFTALSGISVLAQRNAHGLDRRATTFVRHVRGAPHHQRDQRFRNAGALGDANHHWALRGHVSEGGESNTTGVEKEPSRETGRRAKRGADALPHRKLWP